MDSTEGRSNEMMNGERIVGEAKNGGEYLGKGKSGGSILKLRKKWGIILGQEKLGEEHICGHRPRRYKKFGGEQSFLQV